MSEKKVREFISDLPIILLVGFIMYIIFRLFVSRYFGIDEIGHQFESTRSYTAKYYVHLFKVDEVVQNNKVKADLYVEYEPDGDGSSFRIINLETVYLSDNSLLYFDYCIIDSERVSCMDEEGDYWDIEFYNEKVED